MNHSPRTQVGFVWQEVEGQPRRVLPRRFVLRLQQTIGNQAVVRLLRAQSSSTALVRVENAALEKGQSTWFKSLTTAWRRFTTSSRPDPKEAGGSPR